MNGMTDKDREPIWAIRADRASPAVKVSQEDRVSQAVMASQEDKASPAATVSREDRVSPAATVSRECMGRIPCIRDSSLPERITTKL